MIRIIFLFLFISTGLFAQTGIGTTTPHASAKLDVSSTNKGFLPPRVTLTSTTDASTIASPAEGLLVYNLGSVGLQAGYYYWNGANWATIATATSAGNGVTASDMVKIYDGLGNAATINTTGATFSVTTSGKYAFDFSTSATCGNCVVTLNFQVRDGSNSNAVIGSDMQTSYSNNVHAEYNGKVETNLIAGRSYNVLVTASSGAIYSNDYTRVYMKQVAGNLPVTGQSVDYVSVSTIYQTAVGVNKDLIFTSNNGGTIPYNTSTGVFSLSANKTYLFQAQVRANTPSADANYIEYGFVDATTNALLVDGTQTITSSTTSTAGYGSNPVINFIYTPATNQTVKLRTIGTTRGTQLVISGTANITQIGSSAIINPWTLSGTNTSNTTGKVGIGTSSPDASSILDITSTSKGLLPPRVALTAKSGTVTPIASPITGLIVYNTASAGTGGDAVTPGYYYFKGTIWTRMDPEGWSTGVPITLGAITTAPTKGTTSIDYVRYRNVGGKEYEVEYNILFTSVGTAGSGDYLFTLPGGLQFDFTSPGLIAYTGASGYNAMKNRIASSFGDLIVSGFHSSSEAIPYNATQFRIMNNNWGNNTWLMHGPSNYAMSDSTFGMKMIFRFKAL
ncbi:hypothetical protein [Aquirufa antheringensis]|uniref:hypothetical protein n=1 Tax=Aquirufa antheringensis TaxID=2516559 RepID=UPI001032B1DA|nr:hypothetical protein [Aquirufa antheringensis]TBH71532.1 hypothetical protein EWU21_04345 [Aquirufa antheringensis]